MLRKEYLFYEQRQRLRLAAQPDQRPADRIKYIYIQGKRANVQVLTVLDVFSRWNMAERPVAVRLSNGTSNRATWWHCLTEYSSTMNCPSSSTSEMTMAVNGPSLRFVAETVQHYFQDRKVIQEFTRPATPEQNAHIESYQAAFRHSMMQRAVCKRHEFDSLTQAVQALDRFREFYNFRRIHSGVGYKSP